MVIGGKKYHLNDATNWGFLGIVEICEGRLFHNRHAVMVSDLSIAAFVRVMSQSMNYSRWDTKVSGHYNK